MTTIAHLRRARGIKGELIGDSLTSHPERFGDLKRVFLVKNGVSTEAHVQRVWDFRGDPVFKFVGVDSMNDAEPLAGSDVCIPPEERVKLEEGEYFFSDIVGCEAYEADERIGLVAGWQEGPGVTWFEVQEEAKGNRTFLVPYNKAIFREIDIPGRKVKLELPEGLRDLN